MAVIRSRKPGARPHHPSPCDSYDVFAIKALAEGKASDAQQIRALKWIIYTCAGANDTTHYADSTTDSVFANGKRHVGMEIISLINMDMKQKS